MSLEQRPKTAKTPEPPWYKQFWPWFIIALPATAVIASFITLYLAISRPDYIVVEDEEYQRLNSELKAQMPVQQKEQENDQGESDKPDSSSN
jgi:hypothetical protein